MKFCFSSRFGFKIALDATKDDEVITDLQFPAWKNL